MCVPKSVPSSRLQSSSRKMGAQRSQAVEIQSLTHISESRCGSQERIKSTCQIAMKGRKMVIKNRNERNENKQKRMKIEVKNREPYCRLLRHAWECSGPILPPDPQGALRFETVY